MSRACILVVDDEPQYVQLLRVNLQRSGYLVLTALDGRSALAQVEQGSPDLVILDIMLPDLDGYEVCRRIRELSSVPIIMLTAKAEEEHKVRGLSLGADDYVTKPFAAEELLARVAAVLRRSHQEELRTPSPYRCGELRIDFAGHRVTLHAQEVDLSATEYKLLRLLAANAGRVLVQEELLRKVWGVGYEGDSEVLRTAVRRLRQKIEENPSCPKYILTKRGIGYTMSRPES